MRVREGALGATLVPTDCPPIMDYIDRAVREHAELLNRDIEARLRGGAEVVTVELGGGRRIEYRRPAWRRQPIRRLRFEWLRRRR